MLLFCLLSCIVVAVVAACDCVFADNLSLAIVAHSRPHCCYYLLLAFGQFTHWLTPHTYNKSGPNFPVKCIQQILCFCQFDNRFPTQPESIYKGMCVRAPMFISVCVYAHVVFLTSVKWALASWFSRLEVAVAVLCNSLCLPITVCRFTSAGRRFSISVCRLVAHTPRAPGVNATRHSDSACVCALSMCVCVVIVQAHDTNSLAPLAGKCCNFGRLFGFFCSFFFVMTRAWKTNINKYGQLVLAPTRLAWLRFTRPIIEYASAAFKFCSCGFRFACYRFLTECGRVFGARHCARGAWFAGAVSDNDKDTAKTEQSELFELSYQLLLSQTERQAISKSKCEAKQRQHRIKSRKQI